MATPKENVVSEGTTEDTVDPNQRIRDLQREIERLQEQRDAARRAVIEVEAEMGRVRTDFERRVGQRTSDLTKTNKALYEEILDRRKAEHSLRQAEKKYRSIIENAVEGFYQSTPEGQYLSVNPALVRMYAYESQEELLAAIKNIGTEIFVDATVRERFRSAIETQGYITNLEYQVRRRDGRVIWISENARVVRDRHGRILYYEGTVQDITARKEAEAAGERLENQLRQSQKMEAIGTLAGGIAHDFNNMLGAMIGFTELSLDDVPPESRTAQNLREVIQAGYRAKLLVRQILAFSRQDESQRENVSLGKLVAEALTLLRAALPSTIQFHSRLEVPSDIILADPTQIHQVMMNLGTNAGHAMRDTGGSLTVTLAETVVDSSEAESLRLTPGAYLRLSVADNGQGMTPDICERIFEPFFTTKPVGQGTGLGLSVVHGIVTSHGGSITVESVPGEGTTFHVLLPCGESPEKADPGNPEQDNKPGRDRILVVDDEQTLARIMEQRLTRLGYDVVAFSDSAQALKEFQASPGRFDLVITDQTMPHLTGTQLALKLGETRADIPVILCTGMATPPDAQELLRHGIRDCLFKPVDFAELNTVIQRAIHKQQP